MPTWLAASIASEGEAFMLHEGGAYSRIAGRSPTWALLRHPFRYCAYGRGSLMYLPKGP
jgi:hypothetical protein